MKHYLKRVFILLGVVSVLAAVTVSVSAVNTDASYLRGDADGDGIISINDVTAIQRHLAGMEEIIRQNLKAADADSSGAADISDATLIQRRLAEFGGTEDINIWVTEAAQKPTTDLINPGDNELPFIPN